MYRTLTKLILLDEIYGMFYIAYILHVKWSYCVCCMSFHGHVLSVWFGLMYVVFCCCSCVRCCRCCYSSFFSCVPLRNFYFCHFFSLIFYITRIYPFQFSVGNLKCFQSIKISTARINSDKQHPVSSQWRQHIPLLTLCMQCACAKVFYSWCVVAVLDLYATNNQSIKKKENKSHIFYSIKMCSV